MCPFKSLINITTVSASTTTLGRGSYKDPGSFMLLLNPKISLPTNSWPCYWKGHAPWNIRTSDQTSVTFWHLVAAGNRLASNQSWDSFSGRILFTFLAFSSVLFIKQTVKICIWPCSVCESGPVSPYPAPSSRLHSFCSPSLLFRSMLSMQSLCSFRGDQR